jgi:hypothetical protein
VSEEETFKDSALVAIKAFLQDFAALPVAELSDADVEARVQQLKTGLLSHADENPVLKGMLATAAH